jgi:hypothetical protein
LIGGECCQKGKRWNFILSNGDKSDLITKKDDFMVPFSLNGKVISKVQIYYQQKYFYL